MTPVSTILYMTPVSTTLYDHVSTTLYISCFYYIIIPPFYRHLLLVHKKPEQISILHRSLWPVYELNSRMEIYFQDLIDVIKKLVSTTGELYCQQ